MIKYIQLSIVVFLNLLLIRISYASSFEIPFDLVNGLIVVEAEIDGIRGDFILDTGSSDFLINDRVDIGSESFFTAQGQYQVDEVSIENLRIGEINHKAIKAFVADLSTIEDYVDKEIKGVLGSNVFFPKVLIIDFDAGRISFKDELIPEGDDKGKSFIDFTMEAGVPIGTLEIGGRNFSFILDTGASTHFIDKELIVTEDFNYDYTGIEKNVITAFTKENKAKQIDLHNISLGQSIISEKFIALDFSDFESVIDHKIAGLLSINSLSSTVIIDLERNRIIF